MANINFRDHLDRMKGGGKKIIFSGDIDFSVLKWPLKGLRLLN